MSDASPAPQVEIRFKTARPDSIRLFDIERGRRYRPNRVAEGLYEWVRVPDNES